MRQGLIAQEPQPLEDMSLKKEERNNQVKLIIQVLHNIYMMAVTKVSQIYIAVA